MQVRRYFQLVEKSRDSVNVCWKVGHAFVFFIIFVVSVFALATFEHIFDTFNYRCILYAKPHLSLRKIHITPQTMGNDSDYEDGDQLPEPIDNSSQAPLVEQQALRKRRDLRQQWWKKENLLKGFKDIYVVEEELWFYNGTLSGLLVMRMMKTIFSAIFYCDFVMFCPMLSIVLSGFLFTLVVICGRGGRGLSTDAFPQSWRYVYIVLACSILMFLFCWIAFGLLRNGLAEFCKGFVKYSGTTKCNKHINYFTKYQGLGYRKFYMSTVLSYYFYLCLCWFWLAELVLTLLRIVCMVDFEFYTVLIKKKKKTDKDISAEEEEAIWRASAGKKTLYAVYRELHAQRAQKKEKRNAIFQKLMGKRKGGIVSVYQELEKQKTSTQKRQN